MILQYYFILDCIMETSFTVNSHMKKLKARPFFLGAFFLHLFFLASWILWWIGNWECVLNHKIFVHLYISAYTFFSAFSPDPASLKNADPDPQSWFYPDFFNSRFVWPDKPDYQCWESLLSSSSYSAPSSPLYSSSSLSRQSSHVTFSSCWNWDI